MDGVAQIFQRSRFLKDNKEHKTNAYDLGPMAFTLLAYVFEDRAGL